MNALPDAGVAFLVAAGIGGIVARAAFAVGRGGGGDGAEVVVVDGNDQRPLIIRGRGQKQGGLGAAGRRVGQREGDGGGGGVDVSRVVGDRGLDEIPIRGPPALADGVIGTAGEFIGIFQKLGPDGAGFGRTGADVPHPPVIAVPELARRPVGIAQLKHGGPHPRRRPGDVAQIVRGPGGDIHRKSGRGDIDNQRRVAAGLGLRQEGSRRARSKRIQRIIIAGDHIGDGEIPVGVAFHPKLIRLHPLLKVIDPVGGGGLQNGAHPEVGGGGVGVAAVGDDHFAGDGPAPGGGGVIGIGEPAVGPRRLLGRGLGLGVGIQGHRGLGGVGDGVGQVVAIDEIWAIDFGPHLAVGPRSIRAAAVVAAVEHVQNRGADVVHQLALHRAAVVVFGGGRHIPEADIFPAAAPRCTSPRPAAPPGRRCICIYPRTGPGKCRWSTARPPWARRTRRWRRRRTPPSAGSRWPSTHIQLKMDPA